MSKEPREFWVGQKYQFNGHGAEKVWFASSSKKALDEYRSGNKINESIHVIELTPEIEKAVNRDHLFEELVTVANEYLELLQCRKNGYVHANIPCDPETIKQIKQVEEVLEKAKAEK